MTEPKARWLDTTINLQKVMTAFGGLLLTMGVWAYSIASDVQSLKQDRDESKRAVQEMRSDNRDSLRDINQNVKDLSNKFDLMKDQMISNSAGNRPEMRKWSK